jgi:threonyl-tRNA synthetase
LSGFDEKSQERRAVKREIPEQLYKIRHSLAHVMAQAVLQLRPKAKLAFGPPIEAGFYYDFDLESPLTPEDFPEIERRMRRIINERQPFEQLHRPAAEAASLLESAGEVYKVEYCRELAEQGETEIGFFRNGPFEDMCRGPHVAHTGELPADGFAIESIAGAYWRGSEKNPQLTRIYAAAFQTRRELDEYQEKKRLAKERDHRKLGAELELFIIEDEVGPGLPLWLPNGAVLREELENFAKEVEFRAGYHRVVTPHVTKGKLYETSGHLPYYKDSMFPPMELEGEEPYYLKPMNCPHHHMIYRSRPRSYRELPLRLAEYGTVYRYEDSGALMGLLRVRMISQNDAHIYCRPDQLESETHALLDMHDFYYRKFRLSHYWMRLSLHDPKDNEKYMDNPEAWQYTEQVLQRVLEERKADYEAVSGEAAFYGPKIDFQVENVIGREESASTVQLDFAVPARFGLAYIGEDGKEHLPYCIHRAPLGSHERFVAFLIEHFGGAFPTWMAPVQVKIVPVGEKFFGYAERVKAELCNHLMRAEIDLTSESLNKKIRNAVTRKIPNILVVGGKEEESESVTWRRYGSQEQRSLKLGEFSATVRRWVSERVMDNYGEE